MKFIKLFILGLIPLICGCAKGSFEKGFVIGVDPSFFPLQLEGQSNRVFAFSNELLQEIAKVEKIEFVRKNMSWDNLLDCLKSNKCSAVLSSLPLNIINQNKYSFSEPYLHTGVVLIVRKIDKGETLANFSGKTLAIGKTDAEIELMSHFPKVNTVFFDTLAPTLENVVSGRYMGCLVPILLAGPYTKDIFHTTLTISEETPLTNEAIRLVTLKDADPKLIEIFNRGLHKLTSSGKYQALLDKWQLS